MAQRTCEIAGCDKPHGARGMCYSHYGTWHRKTHGRKSNGTQVEITCIVCGVKHMAWRASGKFCSDKCKGQHYSATMLTRCKLPPDHPVRLEIRRQRNVAREPKRSAFEWRTARECPGCACVFTPLYTPNAITCSKRCARKVAKRRRRAREHSAAGTWTWSEFMRIARKFDYCCAYCGTKPDRLDPDHVVPLSRGGFDSPTNLLPACPPCNTDKQAMLLDEWAAWRAARDKPPRTSSWALDDQRFTHLTQALLAVA